MMGYMHQLRPSGDARQAQDPLSAMAMKDSIEFNLQNMRGPRPFWAHFAQQQGPPPAHSKQSPQGGKAEPQLPSYRPHNLYGQPPIALPPHLKTSMGMPDVNSQFFPTAAGGSPAMRFPQTH